VDFHAVLNFGLAEVVKLLIQPPSSESTSAVLLDKRMCPASPQSMTLRHVDTAADTAEAGYEETPESRFEKSDSSLPETIQKF
jgi:hypothetical protein